MSFLRISISIIDPSSLTILGTTMTIRILEILLNRETEVEERSRIPNPLVENKFTVHHQRRKLLPKETTPSPTLVPDLRGEGGPLVMRNE
jgi:hypothetical protein